MGGSFVMLCVRCQVADAQPSSVQCALCATYPGHPRTGADANAAPAVLRSPVALGWATAGLFAAVGLTDLVSAVLDLRLAGLVGRMADGDWAAGERAGGVQQFSVWTGHFWSLVYFASIVVFLVWFRRSRVNAEVFDPHGHTLRRGWAVGGWFVPFANLWLPRRVAVDTWRACASPADRRGTWLLNLWWVTFVVDTVVSNGASRILRRAEELDEIARAYRYVAYSELFSVVHAVIAVLFVLALTRRQHACAHQPWPPVAPGPVPDAPAPEKV
ncbi:DUF4328 domain-containing protein [Streptomyces koyangensis]|uniref:DUF4328 domain-containing protein n=2 Tax=Streptomyces koyangensis TaxID=188770 RepID=A0ABX7ECG5_9ACTN|nr:DUF4328 domain-containing protein [Streptomyces koyangensis]